MDYKETGYIFARIGQLRRWHLTLMLKNKEALYFGQLPLLEYIKSHPGCSQQQIADKFALSRAAVTKSIKRMMAAGLIERNVNETDERQYMLYVTKKSQRLTKTNRDAFAEVDKLTYKGLTEQESEQFSALLLKIQNNLETDYTRDKTPGRLFDEIEKNEKQRKQ